MDTSALILGDRHCRRGANSVACAFGGALSRTNRAALVLLRLAVVPLLVLGVLSMGMGPAFLLAAGFLLAALVKVGWTARAQ